MTMTYRNADDWLEWAQQKYADAQERFAYNPQSMMDAARTIRGFIDG